MRILLLILILLSQSSNSQSWQWGKRGGSSDLVQYSLVYGWERTYKIVTDSNKNIYMLSTVGYSWLDIDGVPKEPGGDPTSKRDVALVSFSCDGTYRWSKIIGGANVDEVQSLQIDTEDNIYICGKRGSCGTNSYPFRIDDDIVFEEGVQDCSSLFITKFSSDGDMQWFKRPLVDTVTAPIGLTQSRSLGMATEADGTSHWLVNIPAGTYANGAFSTEHEGSKPFVFKYSADGNFLSATEMDMHLTGWYLGNIQFYLNPNNSQYYLVTRRQDDEATAVVGGMELSNTLIMASFDSSGENLWYRGSVGGISTFAIFNVLFDPDGSLYLAGMIAGMNTASFIGFSAPDVSVPGFLMKVNEVADTVVWSTYHNKSTTAYGAIALNDDEIGYTSTGFGTDFTWGNQSLNISATNEGTEVILARFNKTSGECIGLTKIPGNIGYDDHGSAIAVDASGDYIIGGGFARYLYFDNDAYIFNEGQSTDFFVAKYSTEACSPLAVNDFEEDRLKAYPNPFTNHVQISVSSSSQYQLYTLTGALIATGSLTPDKNTIATQDFAAGTYVIKLINSDGEIQNLMLLKQ